MRNLFFLIALFLLPLKLLAQDPIERVWYNAEKTAKVQVYKAKDGKFYGKIVWLKEPVRNGKPRVDENNNKSSERSKPLMGLVVLKGLQKEGKEYEEGTIYDPKNGKTYSCNAKFNGKNLELRGYVGVSLLGRTSTWTPAD